jgi:hypothetical protein
MNERYEHILSTIDLQIDIAERDVIRYKHNGWDDLLPEAQERVAEWKLLYDAVDQGLIDALKADFGAVLLSLAGVPA